MNFGGQQNVQVRATKVVPVCAKIHCFRAHARPRVATWREGMGGGGPDTAITCNHCHCKAMPVNIFFHFALFSQNLLFRSLSICCAVDKTSGWCFWLWLTDHCCTCCKQTVPSQHSDNRGPTKTGSAEHWSHALLHVCRRRVQ